MALSVIGRNQIALNVNSLEWQSLKTASFTASAGEAYPVDTTSSGITVTLPASPSAGHTVQVLDVAATADSNFITLARNGNKINGSTTNVALGKERGVVSVVYSGSSQGWVVSATAGTGTTSIGEILTVEALIIAGGGSGSAGYGNGNGSGGGGAGGLLYKSSVQIIQGYDYTVTVGAGGAQTTENRGSNSGGQHGLDGEDSVFNGNTAIGGGGGGGPAGSVANGNDGGSGGGGGSTSGSGGSGTSGQGNDGGDAGGHSYYRGGGGGGAGGAGTTATSTPNGGAGSNTYSTWATATSTGVSGYYAGGGGGGDYTGNHSSGSGGSGGGGSGAGGTSNGSSATANTGSGGGGGGSPSTGSTGGKGGAGGSGLVIIRYSGSQSGSGGTVVESGGYAYHTFLSSGTYTA
jgi:hypothetical protein